LDRRTSKSGCPQRRPVVEDTVAGRGDAAVDREVFHQAIDIEELCRVADPVELILPGVKSPVPPLQQHGDGQIQRQVQGSDQRRSG